ncbi:hypothetical protein [Pseudomonas proteolytica]|uniref:DUF3077 domain-containing protein n=1 Tax=Pseudomonas proteolytica TaxID=219574 RepID=A0AAW5AB03_9PSED|nr:hypothetical protein [Pseudomonas proteolytica]KAA8704639.1 hypothetical protein F4W61_06840 [Pseudomonas proteolytica]MCF5059614.1 hypothetical protein [Pseudomonas proteolytica]MCF5099482.1 hypothetical protein [Pseudomonas proteolytica]NMZ06281.1 hypothetical protein [Pseudomonas proteolytica]NMZ10499.1 hypothetical protein [Pseudomonas proteolytica]
MKRTGEELNPNELYASAMQAGICDALKIIGNVLATDSRTRELFKQTCDGFIATAPQRLGDLGQNPLVMEGYREPLMHLMKALHLLETGAKGPLSTH